jgi:hypothetical protein
LQRTLPQKRKVNLIILDDYDDGSAPTK